jgi:hypothetical protein
LYVLSADLWSNTGGASLRQRRRRSHLILLKRDGANVQIFQNDCLDRADLCVDATYVGGRSGNAGDDPLSRLLGVSNMGGFRYRGTLAKLELVVLTSSLNDPDWPDGIDLETGVYTYYGDNKKPGRALHQTPRNGNELLRRIFDQRNARGPGTNGVPPILIFAGTGEWRDVTFLGLAVPGTPTSQSSEDLVAIWKSVEGKRFQNYRARFTILDAPVVSRAWLDEIRRGNPRTSNAPAAWLAWTDGGNAQALSASRSVEHRTKSEQLPSGGEPLRIIMTIHQFFAGRPHDFEGFAASVARMLLPNTTALDLTRPSRDGGRDALGQFRIGRGETSILVRYSLEAKCYAPSRAVGVREMSRLISRLRHREFGILITTSYLDNQAYREIREDSHPIIVVSGSDIVELLRGNGYGTVGAVLDWLEHEFQ